MNSIRAILSSYLQDSENQTLREALQEQCGDHEEKQLWRAVRDAPADAESLAQLLAHMLLAGTDKSTVLDAATRCGQSAPRDEQGDEVARVVGEVIWRFGEQPTLAEPYLRRVRRATPADPVVLAFYRELFATPSQAAQLFQVLLQARRGISDKKQQFDLAKESASIALDRLQDVERAVEIWRAYVRDDGQNSDARAELKAILRRAQKWTALVDVVKSEIERPEYGLSDEQRVQGWLDLAEIYRTEMKLDAMEQGALQRALEIDERCLPAIELLASAHERAGRWSEYLALQERMIAIRHDDEQFVCDTLRKIAHTWQERLGNVQRAIEPLRELLSKRPDDDETRETLASYLEQRRDWRALINLRRAQAQRISESDKRLAARIKLAHLCEEKLGDRREAISDWNAVLEDDNRQGAALLALSRLYAKEQRWPHYIEVLSRRADVAVEQGDMPTALEGLTEIGRVWDERLHDKAQSFAIWKSILELAPAHSRVFRDARDYLMESNMLDQVVELYHAHGHVEELPDYLLAAAERQGSVEQQLVVLRKCAELCEGTLARPDRARTAYERILLLDTTGQEARVQLAQIYREQENWPRLAGLLEKMLKDETDPDARITRLDELCWLAQEQLHSPALALSWANRAYREQPTQERRVTFVERARAAGGWDALIEALEWRLADSAISFEERFELLEMLARISGEELGKTEDARRYYQQILQIDPNNEASIAALTKIFAETRRWGELIDILERSYELASDDTAQIAILNRIYRVCHENLGDPIRSGVLLGRLLEKTPDDLALLQAAAANDRVRGDWEQLVEHLSQLLEQTNERRPRVDYLLEKADLLIGRLERAHEGVQALIEVLELSPNQEKAIAALESACVSHPEVAVASHRGLLPYYRQTADLPAQARCVQLLAENEDDEAAKLALRLELAKILEGLEGRATEALKLRCELFEEHPGKWEMRQALRGCSERVGDWRAAAEAFKRAIAKLSQALAKVETFDPGQQRASYALRRDLDLELAAILRDRLGQPREAERYYLEVFEQDESHQASYDSLVALYKQRDAFDDLSTIYRRRIDAIFNPREQRGLLTEMIAIAHRRQQDINAAIVLAEELFELAPTEVEVIRSLVGLYRERGGPKDALRLDELLSSWAELSLPVDERHQLLLERSRLQRSELDDIARAVDLLGIILAEDPSHPKARGELESYLRDPGVSHHVIQILEPIYETAGDDAALIRILELKQEQALANGQADLAVGVLLRIAAIEQKREHHERAFVVLRQAVAIDPRRQDVVDQFAANAAMIGRRDVFVHELEQALMGMHLGRDARIDLTARVAETLLAMPGERARARDALRSLVALRSEDLVIQEKALEDLAALERESQDWEALIDVREQQQRLASSRVRQRELAVEVAEIASQRLHRPEQAAASWRRVLELFPGDLSARTGLRATYEELGEWVLVAELLESTIAQSDEPQERATLWMETAEIYASRVQDSRAAANAYRAAYELHTTSEDAEKCLSNLVDLTWKLADWPACEDYLRKLLGIKTERSEKLAVLCRLSELFLVHRRQPLAGLEMLKRASEIAWDDDRVIELLWRAAEIDQVADEALEMLLPALEKAQNVEKWISAQELHARRQPSGRRRLAAYLSVADAYETRLGAPEKALTVLCESLAEAVDQPELASLVERCERLAVLPEQQEQLYAAYRSTVEQILDASIQSTIFARIGKLALGQLGDLAAARYAYERVVQRDGDNLEAASALEWIYIREADHGALADLLSRRAERTSKPEERDDSLLRAAEIRHRQLYDAEGAIALYERASQSALSADGVQSVLEELYEQTGRHRSLASHLARRISGLSGNQLVETHLRLGRLYGEQLNDPEEGLRHLAAALHLDPYHAVGTTELRRYLDDKAMRSRAAALLEPLFAGVQDWSGLLQVQEIRLTQVSTREERVALLLKMARIREEQLEDLDAAFEQYARIFAEEPENRYVREQLSRLTGVLGRHHQYAEMLTGWIAEQEDDSPQLKQLMQEAVALWRGPARDPARAVALLQRLAKIGADEPSVLPELIAALTEAKMWQALVDLYWQEVDGNRTQPVRVRLLLELARVAREQLESPEHAVNAYRRVLELAPDNEEARRGLESALSESGSHAQYVELLIERIARLSEPRDKAAVLLQVAQVQVEALDDWDAAADTLAQILEIVPDSNDAVYWLERIAHDQPAARARVHELLAPIYFASENWERCAQILTWRLQSAAVPSERHAIYRELAPLLAKSDPRGKVAQLDLLSQALSEPGDRGQFDLLDSEVIRVARDMDAPELAARAFAQAAESSALQENIDRQIQLLSIAAGLQLRDDPATSSGWLERASALAPSSPDVLRLLERALLAAGQVERAQTVLERLIECTNDDHERVGMLRRLAEIRASLGLSGVDECWRRVLDLVPNDTEALERLSVIYEHPGAEQELADILDQRILSASQNSVRRDLRMQLAKLAREKLADRDREIELLRAVVAENSQDETALRYLADALEAAERPAEATQVLVEVLHFVPSPSERTQLHLRVAKIYDEILEDPESAVEHFAHALVLTPGQSLAVAELTRLARDVRVADRVVALASHHFAVSDRYEELVDVIQARTELDSDAEENALRLEKIAEIYETKLANPNAAIAANMRVVQASSLNQLTGHLDHLLRRAQRLGNLSAVLDELTALVQDRTLDAERRVALGIFVAKCSREIMGDLERAMGALEHLLTSGIADISVCDQLAEVAHRLGRGDLEVRALEEAVRADSSTSLRDAQRRVLLGNARYAGGDAEGGIDAFREALDIAPELESAIDGLERILDQYQGEPSRVLLDALDVVYLAREDQHGLARILRIRISYAQESELSSWLLALGNILDSGLGAPGESLHVWGRMLELDPTSATALGRVLGLANDTGLTSEACDLLLSASRSAIERRLVAPDLIMATARCWLNDLREPERAAELLDGLADLDRDVANEPEPLKLRVEVARALGNFRKLYEVLLTAASLEQDGVRRVGLLDEAARIAKRELQDPASQRAALELLLAADDTIQPAWDALESVLNEQRDLEALLDTLISRQRTTADAARRVEIGLRSVEILEKGLNRAADAAATLLELVDAHPDDARIYERLAPLLAAQGRWEELRDVWRARGERCEGEERLRALRNRASISLQHLDDVEGAISALREAATESPTVLPELCKLLRERSMWRDLVDVLRDRLASLGPDDADTTRQLSLELAEICRVHLGDVAQSEEVLTDLDRRWPNDADVLVGLVGLYEAKNDDDALREVVARVVALQPRGEAGARLCLRMARLATSDAEALEALERAFELCPSLTSARDMLLDRYETQQRWSDALRVLERASECSDDPAQQRELLLRRIDLLIEKLDDSEGALRVMSTVYAAVQNDAELNRRIADTLYSVGRLEEALGLYKWLSDTLAPAKRSKQGAHYLSRIGSIYLATGGSAQGAVSVFEDAFKLDPTNLEMLSGLGALYEQEGRLPDALKIYRSMLLQDMERSKSVRRGDVYLRLAAIHMALGERGKVRAMLRRGLEEDGEHVGLKQALEQVETMAPAE